MREESFNTLTSKQFLLYQQSCNSVSFLLQSLWGGGIFAIIPASLATPGSLFSQHSKLLGVWRQDKLVGNINKCTTQSCANGISCAMETACACRYICALADFKASITFVMEICITEWIQSISYLQAKWAFRGQVRHCCSHVNSVSLLLAFTRVVLDSGRLWHGLYSHLEEATVTRWGKYIYT